MKPKTELRRSRLPNKNLQLRLTGLFVGMSAVGLATQHCLSMLALRSAVRSVPNVPEEFVTSLTSSLAGYAALTALVLFPLTIAVGVFATFRIAGPVYRIEQHLLSLSRGEDPGTCRVREGDEFQNVVDALNAAMEKLDVGESAATLSPDDRETADVS